MEKNEVSKDKNIKIGDPVSRDRAIRVLQRFSGIVEQATENELANACARADRTGLFTCPHTGVALASLFKLVESGVISLSDRVVVISTAHGLKFPDTKVKYHEGRLKEMGIETPLKNEPIEVEPNFEDVKTAIWSELERRI